MNPLMTHHLSLLLDPESFVSRCTPDDGELVGGTGTIGGRRVCIIAINPEACGPVDPFEVLQQELALLDLAEEESLPLIHLADRPGRVAMGTTAIPLAIMRTFIDSRGAGRIFARFAHLSGVVPRIAVVFSPIATTLTYPVVECDTVVMTDLAGMSLARPDMVRLMMGDPSPYEDYGGARMHTEISGTSDKLVFSEKDAMDWVWKYIAFFPSHFSKKPPRASLHLPSPDYAGLKDVIPEDPDLPFDMHDVIHSFIDKGSLHEHRALYAREVITAFASLCDSFNIPLVFSAIANLSVPHLCIVVRKAYTAGLYAMGGPGFAPERFVAFPHATITIYGAKAIQLLARESHLSDNERAGMADQMRANCDVQKYAESGLLDAAIGEDQLRVEVGRFLESVGEKPLDRTGPRRVLCL